LGKQHASHFDRARVTADRGEEPSIPAFVGKHEILHSLLEVIAAISSPSPREDFDLLTFRADNVFVDSEKVVSSSTCLEPVIIRRSIFNTHDGADENHA
jgi:hypothetical protein